MSMAEQYSAACNSICELFDSLPLKKLPETFSAVQYFERNNPTKTTQRQAALTN